jgi:DNA-binding NtrC family response regulator
VRDTETQRDDGEGAAGLDNGLLLVAGEGILTTFPLRGGETVIGRADECDVVIAHPTLSRKHAILRLGPPMTVQDLGSKNGTRVARKLLEGGEPAALAVGESFHIGRFSFVVVRAPRSRTLSSRQAAAEALHVLDPTVQKATSLVRDIAQSKVNALILGETGVGKEVLAGTLHELSGRKGALVRINCAALTPSLFESELFGHEKGAFTGAESARVGLLEAANKGTAFLDEVGELPSPAQAKLLRAIETKEITRVGGTKPISLDVRFVAATNRDLPDEAARGHFRSDLYFRLDGVTLVIPPLRERRDQVAPLALHFLRESNPKTRLAPTLIGALESYDWPGNVRELKAVLERAALLARGGEIRPEHLAFTKQSKSAPPPAPDQDDQDDEEKRRILAALDACAGNQTRAAKKLGMARSTLVHKMALYKLPRPRK